MAWLKTSPTKNGGIERRQQRNGQGPPGKRKDAVWYEYGVHPGAIGNVFNASGYVANVQSRPDQVGYAGGAEGDPYQDARQPQDGLLIWRC